MNFETLSLFTDLYELTMMQGYFFNAPDEKGVFEMFYRKQPFKGGYTIFAGLEPFLDALQQVRFSKSDIDYLKGEGIFKDEFLDFLKSFSFRGDIYSMTEGTIAFSNEPLVRVHGTMMETQLIESMVLNFINYQTLVATKASRIVDQAGPKPVLEFGLRRAHGMNGAMSATRAAYIGGAGSTSNTLAGKEFNIPVAGTMAHSWVMSFESELESFEKYAKLYPEKCILLVDTFDTLRSGVPNAIEVFKKLKNNNHSGLLAIRIDSGDLEYLSKKARKLLDKNDCKDVKIFVSSDVDEYIITQLQNSGTPIDAWGVGTMLVTGGTDPVMTGVYKIVAKEKDGRHEPCIKISNQPEKITNPGIKNIMRFSDDTSFLGDLLFLEEERESLLEKVRRREPVPFHHPSNNTDGFVMKRYTDAKILLTEVISKGLRTVQLPSLEETRRHRQEQINQLDPTFRRLLNPHIYKVSLTEKLRKEKTDLIQSIRATYY